MKIIYLVAPVYLLGLVYMCIPAKPLPSLTNSGISLEPGDTYQNPTQRGFYSNLTRGEVLEQVQTQTKISLFGINIPSFRLNYRPEEAGTLVRDQLKSNYLEEIVYPLHSSVYVNGWEPKKAPIRDNNQNKIITDLYLNGVPFDAKITFKPVTSSLLSRLIVWTMIFPGCYFVAKSLKKSFKND